MIELKEPERQLYLAVADSKFETVFDDELGRLIMRKENLRICVFNPETEEIVQWIK